MLLTVRSAVAMIPVLRFMIAGALKIFPQGFLCQFLHLFVFGLGGSLLKPPLCPGILLPPAGTDPCWLEGYKLSVSPPTRCRAFHAADPLIPSAVHCSASSSFGLRNSSFSAMIRSYLPLSFRSSISFCALFTFIYLPYDSLNK